MQAGIPLATVLRFLPRPGNKAVALQCKETPQIIRLEGLTIGRFFLADHVEVHHRQVDLFQRQLGAQQPAVHLGLSPVQAAVVVRDAGDIAAVGLDLFQQVLRGVVAVGPAGYQ